MGGFTVNSDISAIFVFVQGLLSFFSPCVLPLLPVYIGYLSGGTVARDTDGRIRCDRKKVMVNTVFFVIGVSFAFFLLGLGMSAVGSFFGRNQLLFARIGGVLVIIFGLLQLGLFGGKVLGSEKRLPLNLQKMTMSPLTALVMGFVLSFAWTPCVGPALTSVLLMATSASGSSAAGFALIGVYTFGYALPFLLVGFFTGTLLEFFGKHRNFTKYTARIGGVLLIVMGILMVTGKMNDLSGYFASISQPAVETEDTGASDAQSGQGMTDDNTDGNASDTDSDTVADADSEPVSEAEGSQAAEPAPAIDFTLKDQFGETHSLADYRGQVLFLNFWATWCPPCRAEMPYIQELYEYYSAQEDPEVAIVGVSSPIIGGEKDEDGIAAFMKENGYTYPTLMDSGGFLSAGYYISAIPTTFMIDPEGNVIGYVTGGMDKATMEDIIAQSLELSGR
ncbi:MAG: redoxin domain-containing protein [Lachnospiraceae bacterium]|nr:redoxin domain-containing protein [Lachnospiraceae bacterium]